MIYNVAMCALYVAGVHPSEFEATPGRASNVVLSHAESTTHADKLFDGQ